MSTEIKLNYPEWVKSVEFFPYEWSSNLIAVCLKSSIKIYLYEERSEQGDNIYQSMRERDKKAELKMISEVSCNQRLDFFSWSPKTNISILNPILQFAACDSENNLIIYTIPVAVKEAPHSEKQIDELLDCDTVHSISFDHHNGELLACTADNMCLLIDVDMVKLRAKFYLQSPGVQICWHRDETTKLMIAEKGGFIRVYNLELLRPTFTLMCLGSKIESLPVLSADWCQINPEIVVASTISDVLIWNTSSSCVPESLVTDSENIRLVKLAKYKENMIATVTGNDICAKLKIFNYKTNQIIYQKKDIKLFKSFNFNAMQPLIALANENQLVITKLIA